jgi:hypothetical protein
VGGRNERTDAGGNGDARPLLISVPLAGRTARRGLSRQGSYAWAKKGMLPTVGGPEHGTQLLVPVGALAAQMHVPIEVIWQRIAELEAADRKAGR